MSNSKEVASLKKELEALQKEIEGSKTPGSQASMSLADDPAEGLSLGPSAVQSPEFGPGGTGASDALANAAIPATDAQQLQTALDNGTSERDVRETPSTTSLNTESDSIPLRRDMSIPRLRLEDIDAEGSLQESNNDAMSDSSAVVVDAEDGQPANTDI